VHQPNPRTSNRSGVLRRSAFGTGTSFRDARYPRPKKSTVTVTAPMIARKVPEKVPASALALEARLVCSRALVCLLFPVWVRWLPPAGLPQWLSVLQRVLPREGLWELSRKRASRKKRRHCTAEGVRRGGEP
jgi:hypothetical protein